MKTAAVAFTGGSAAVEGDELVIRVALKGDHKPSSTGKTKIVASSNGNIPILNDVIPGLKLGLNVMRPNE